MSDSSIALNRFGLGARPADSVPAQPKAWLIDQFARFDPRPPAIAAAPTSAEAAADLADYQAEQRALRQERRQVAAPAPPTPDATMAGAPPMNAPAAPQGQRTPRQQARRDARQRGRDDYVALVGARATAAIASDTPFVERLVHFWANHFAVSADKLTVVGLAGTLEFEAIRPHVLGRFADMLNAVERHPAMLLYLDQAASVGPDSPIGRRAAARAADGGATDGGAARKVGLNENLAREILELHTLGVRTGYTQADVTEFARAMTGWTVAGLGRAGRQAVGRQGAGQQGAGSPGAFLFAPALHEPGARTIMGRRYAEGGEAQAQAVLGDLAVHPATAAHVATKLARHFAGDTPPPAMVARLTAAFLTSGGDLPTVYRAIVASPEAWVAAPVKFRTPWDWTLATYRALGTTTVPPLAIVGLANQLGQPVWKPGQPVGYDDIAGSWAAPDAVMRRVEAAERFAARAPDTLDARAIAPRLFPGALSPATAQALQRAESPAQALALMLVSPEMMRR